MADETDMPLAAPAADQAGPWQSLLPFLRCPVSHQPLTLAPPPVVAALNTQRQAGQLPCEATGTGRLQIDLAQPLEAVLTRRDQPIGYVVQNGVPILLPDHAMRLPAPQTGTTS